MTDLTPKEKETIGAWIEVLLFFLKAVLVCLLWNRLMPSLFGLPELTGAQAIGLYLLARLVFGHKRTLREAE